jgi:hypothetical protein
MIVCIAVLLPTAFGLQFIHIAVSFNDGFWLGHNLYISFSNVVVIIWPTQSCFVGTPGLPGRIVDYNVSNSCRPISATLVKQDQFV